jgi:diguanylate cyclase (GGDEF)-like protein
MGNTTQIIKDTFVALKKKNLEATPKNYSREFYAQAKTHNLHLDEYDISSIDEEKLKIFIHELGDVLGPSIDFVIKDEIAKFISNKLQNPSSLFEIDTLNEMKNITATRITNDKTVVKNKTNDIIKLTKLLSKQFQKMILTSDNSSHAFLDIKEELLELNISKSSSREINGLQTKLIDSIQDIEKAIEAHRYSVLQEKENLEDIEEKFLQLQEELKQAQSEKNIDYLTNIYNRRAFDTELEKIEKKYNIFHSNYAIALYDIDHFKKINDKYGHACGDNVLKTFATLLNKLSRDIDVLARYGGEEFIIILNYDDKSEITRYVKRIKDLIQHREFKYKDHLIEVKFSGGIALRGNNKTPLETINKADHLLYEAKAQGRDKVILEDGSAI